MTVHSGQIPKAKILVENRMGNKVRIDSLFISSARAKSSLNSEIRQPFHGNII